MTTAVAAPGAPYPPALGRLRLAIAFAAAGLALLGASGLLAPLLFSSPDAIKYAATVLGPLLVLTACVSRDPFRIFVGASIVATPFGSLVATFAGQEVTLLAPLLLAAVGLAIATGRRRAQLSPVGSAALLAGVLLIIPLANGAWGSYLTVIIVATAIAYVVARVASDGDGGLTFVLGAVVLSAAIQAVIAIWEFKTGNQFNPYRESASNVYGRNYFFGFENLNRPAAAFFDPISLGNVLALALPIAVALCVAVRESIGRLLALAGAGLIGVGLTLTFSRMSWIGAMVGILVAIAFLPRGPRQKALTGVLVTALAVFAIATATAGSQLATRFDSILHPTARTTRTADGDRMRLELWQGATRTAETNPLFGVGIGEIAPALAQRGAPSTPGIHAHSTYLQLLAEGGALGGFALLLVILGTFRGIREGLRRNRVLIAGLGGAFAAVLVVWVTDYTVRYTNVAASMAVLVGVAAAQWPTGTDWAGRIERLRGAATRGPVERADVPR